MRRSVLVTVSGPARLVSSYPIDVLQHGEAPRHKVMAVIEPREPFTARTSGAETSLTRVHPRDRLLALLRARAATPMPATIEVRLPRRLSRERRTMAQARRMFSRFGQPHETRNQRASALTVEEVGWWLRGLSAQGQTGDETDDAFSSMRGVPAALALGNPDRQSRGSVLITFSWNMRHRGQGLGLPKRQPTRAPGRGRRCQSRRQREIENTIPGLQPRSGFDRWADSLKDLKGAKLSNFLDAAREALATSVHLPPDVLFGGAPVSKPMPLLEGPELDRLGDAVDVALIEPGDQPPSILREQVLVRIHGVRLREGLATRIGAATPARAVALALQGHRDECEGPDGVMVPIPAGVRDAMVFMVESAPDLGPPRAVQTGPVITLTTTSPGAGLVSAFGETAPCVFETWTSEPSTTSSAYYRDTMLFARRTTHVEINFNRRHPLAERLTRAAHTIDPPAFMLTIDGHSLGRAFVTVQHWIADQRCRLELHAESAR